MCSSNATRTVSSSFTKMEVSFQQNFQKTSEILKSYRQKNERKERKTFKWYLLLFCAKFIFPFGSVKFNCINLPSLSNSLLLHIFLLSMLSFFYFTLVFVVAVIFMSLYIDGALIFFYFYTLDTIPSQKPALNLSLGVVMVMQTITKHKLM